MKHKLDIFDTLDQIDRKNRLFFQTLSEDNQKSFYPVVVQKWLSGINCEQQILFLNEFVNPLMHVLYKHPNIIYKSMTVCTNGHKQKYKWMKTKKESNKDYKIDIICKFYDYSRKQAQEVKELIPNCDIIDMALQLDYSDNDINKIKKLYG